MVYMMHSRFASRKASCSLDNEQVANMLFNNDTVVSRESAHGQSTLQVFQNKR